MFTTTLVLSNSLRLLEDIQRRLELAVESKPRSIDCLLQCGDEPCHHQPLKAVPCPESEEQKKDNDLSPDMALLKQEQALPLMIDGIRKKSVEAGRAEENAPKYSVQKRCNCLTHQKRAIRLGDLSEAATKASEARHENLCLSLTSEQRSEETKPARTVQSPKTVSPVKITPKSSNAFAFADVSAASPLKDTGILEAKWHFKTTCAQASSDQILARLR